ncbi:MAG: hypothetical protein EOP48_34075, partial [Sphingobacteriales bacterium]
MEYLFYPRLRAQHSITYTSNQYNFKDISADSAIYKDWYNFAVDTTNTVSLAEKWKIIENDFSLIQFPDPKNPAQFLKAGATLQNIQGTLDSSNENFYNVRLH